MDRWKDGWIETHLHLCSCICSELIYTYRCCRIFPSSQMASCGTASSIDIGVHGFLVVVERQNFSAGKHHNCSCWNPSSRLKKRATEIYWECQKKAPKQRKVQCGEQSRYCLKMHKTADDDSLIPTIGTHSQSIEAFKQCMVLACVGTIHSPLGQSVG